MKSLRDPARHLQKLTRLAEGVNAYTLAFDEALLNELRTLYETKVRDFLDLPRNARLFKGGEHVEERWQQEPHMFYASSYAGAPLLWVSSDNSATHEVFARFFRSLDIADDVKTLIDFKLGVVVYCGFFVVGEYLAEAKWHVDYFPNANAYTLIAPLFELDTAHGNLLYRDSASCIGRYRYRTGEAIVLGEGFTHTTEPYQPTSRRRVLVSLTFGTDKLDYWSVLKDTAGAQSDFLILPCGHERGTCSCLETLKHEHKPDPEKAISAWANLQSGDRVVISPLVWWQECDGSMDLCDASGNRLATLDPMGACMWTLFARFGRVAAVRAELLARYDVETGQLDQDLARFVRSLTDAGLIELVTAAVEGA